MISLLDISIVIGYTLLVFVIATYFSRRQGLEGFLVNKRSTKLWLLVFSIVSTNVGAGFFLSVAAEAYVTGISFGISMILVSTATALTFAFLSKKIKKMSDDGNIHTVPELLTKRYHSPVTGSIAAIITLGGYLFVTALQFVGIGSVGSAISGFDFAPILLISGIVTVAYTAIGGIRSDIIADAVSFVIMVVVLAIVVPLIGLSDHVNFSKLQPSQLSPVSFGGLSFLVLSILLAVISAFMFMELWQRIFAAESPKTARKAFFISAIIQPLFIGTGIYLGLSASLLYDGVDKSVAIFKLMADFLPPGLLGLGLVAVLAILMTTVNSLVVVGGSTLFTDILKPRLKNLTEKSQLRWVRLLTVLFGICALCLSFIFPDLVRLLLMGAFIMMPICPTIVWALFSRTPSAKAAITSMITGVAVTFVLLPFLPETAFGPGFLASLLVLVINHYYKKYRTIKRGEQNA